MQIDISQLISKRGFFLYKDFLTSIETTEVANIYKKLSNSDNKNYPVKVLDLNVMPDSIYNKLDSIKAQCFPLIKSEITNAAFFSVNTDDLHNSIKIMNLIILQEIIIITSTFI